jgi:hypothetical protein
MFCYDRHTIAHDAARINPFAGSGGGDKMASDIAEPELRPKGGDTCPMSRRVVSMGIDSPGLQAAFCSNEALFIVTPPPPRQDA